MRASPVRSKLARHSCKLASTLPRVGTAWRRALAICCQALVACAGVTLRAVATALGVPVHGGTVTAEGDLDFRGTLGVSREASVGFADIRLRFDLETDATPAQLEQVLKLTERYCVVYQTLRSAPPVSITLRQTPEQ